MLGYCRWRDIKEYLQINSKAKDQIKTLINSGLEKVKIKEFNPQCKYSKKEHIFCIGKDSERADAAKIAKQIFTGNFQIG